jgi:peptidyl-prolyl cis-trans isomerase SurA
MRSWIRNQESVVNGQLFMVSIFLFFLLFTVFPVSAQIIDKIAARINGDIILMSDVKGRSFQILNEIQKRDENREEVDVNKLEREVLNEMIEEKLIIQYAHDNNIKVSDEDIRGALEDIKKQNNLSDEMLESALKKENIPLHEYKERLKEQIIIPKVISYEVRSKVHIDENELRQYYEEHLEEFVTPEEVRVRHIILLFNDSTDRNKEGVIRKKAADILKRIKQGEDFAHLASMFSEDQSAKNDGDLGYFTRGKMIKIFEDTAFRLKKGEVSDIIRTPFGFHILKCEDRRDSGYRPLPEVSPDIEKKIFAEKMKSLKDAWFKKLKEKAFIEVLY